MGISKVASKPFPIHTELPVPFAVPLEQGFLPKGRLKEAVERVLGY